MLRKGERVQVLHEPFAAAPEVRTIAARYAHWMRAENSAVSVYVGQQPGLKPLLVVVRKGGEVRKAVISRFLDARDWALGLSRG